MCTALSFVTKDHYFGRNLDIDRSYGEEVCVVPRHYPFTFRTVEKMEEHYAIIGMATVVEKIPLFYDAANEHGLAMAGLNFPGNAYYAPYTDQKDNITPFEFIPWILGQCKTVAEAKILLEHINLVNISFSDSLPLSPLHWLISDRKSSIVIESMKDGLHVYDDPYGVLTNNPPFPYQLENLNQYEYLRNDNKQIKRMSNLSYDAYCQGLGAVGLPGDVSSMSRFVRIVFGRETSVCTNDETSSVSQFFHLLSSVEMIRGACKTDEGTWDITVYTACMNTDKGIYYYKMYDDLSISCINMYETDLEGSILSRYPLTIQKNME